MQMTARCSGVRTSPTTRHSPLRTRYIGMLPDTLIRQITRLRSHLDRLIQHLALRARSLHVQMEPSSVTKEPFRSTTTDGSLMVRISPMVTHLKQVSTETVRTE